MLGRTQAPALIDIGRALSNLVGAGPNPAALAKFGQNRAKFGRCLPGLGNFRPELVVAWRCAVEFGKGRASLGPNSAESGRCLVDPGPIMIEVVRFRSNIGRSWAKFCRSRGEIGRDRRSIGRDRPRFGRKEHKPVNIYQNWSKAARTGSKSANIARDLPPKSTKLWSKSAKRQPPPPPFGNRPAAGSSGSGAYPTEQRPNTFTSPRLSWAACPPEGHWAAEGDGIATTHAIVADRRRQRDRRNQGFRCNS